MEVSTRGPAGCTSNPRSAPAATARKVQCKSAGGLAASRAGVAGRFSAGMGKQTQNSGDRNRLRPMLWVEGAQALEKEEAVSIPAFQLAGRLECRAEREEGYRQAADTGNRSGARPAPWNLISRRPAPGRLRGLRNGRPVQSRWDRRDREGYRKIRLRPRRKPGT